MYTEIHIASNFKRCANLGQEYLKEIRSCVQSFDFSKSWTVYRNNHSQMFFKTGVFKGFAKFTGKRLCQSLFFNKVAGPKASFKKRLWSRCFLVSFVKYLRTLFKQNTSGVRKKNKEAELNQLIFISVTNTFAIHFTQYNTQNLLS